MILIFLQDHLYLFPVSQTCRHECADKMTTVSRNENNKCRERKTTPRPLATLQVQFTDGASILEDSSICIWKGKQRQQIVSVRKSLGNNILSEKSDKRTTFLKAARSGHSNSKTDAGG